MKMTAKMKNIKIRRIAQFTKMPENELKTKAKINTDFGKNKQNCQIQIYKNKQNFLFKKIAFGD